jgi:hypothetical protein
MGGRSDTQRAATNLRPLDPYLRTNAASLDQLTSMCQIRTHAVQQCAVATARTGKQSARNVFMQLRSY